MEQILQSIQNQTVYFVWEHMLIKNQTLIHRTGQRKQISIFDAQTSHDDVLTTNHVLLVLEPDFFKDMSYIDSLLQASEQKPRIFCAIKSINWFAHNHSKNTFIKKSKDFITRKTTSE